MEPGIQIRDPSSSSIVVRAGREIEDGPVAVVAPATATGGAWGLAQCRKPTVGADLLELSKLYVDGLATSEIRCLKRRLAETL